MEDQKYTPLPWKTNIKKYDIFDDQEIAVIPSCHTDNGGRHIAFFVGPDREANAALFMDAPGMAAKIQEIARAHAKTIDEQKSQMNLLEAQHDAAIESMLMYQRVEVTKLQAEIENMKTQLAAEKEKAIQRITSGSVNAYDLRLAKAEIVELKAAHQQTVKAMDESQGEVVRALRDEIERLQNQ